MGFGIEFIDGMVETRSTKTSVPSDIIVRVFRDNATGTRL